MDVYEGFFGNGIIFKESLDSIIIGIVGIIFMILKWDI